MRVTFTPDGWDDHLYWQTQDRKTLRRINELIRDIGRGVAEDRPHEGIGKPEALKYANLTGWWSRRITDEHRLVYRVSDDEITVAACRYHYV